MRKLICTLVLVSLCGCDLVVAQTAMPVVADIAGSLWTIVQEALKTQTGG